MTAVYKRELKGYFNSFTGYAFIAFILLVAGIYTWYINFLNQSARFEYILYNLNFIYLIAVPILTMRVIAEDRKQKTDQLLYSLPLSGYSIVTGKFFAMVTVLLIPMLVIGIYPLILSAFGTVELVTCYATLAGFFLLGMTLISVGMFISSLTENQIVAAGGAFAVLLISYLSSTISSGVPTTAFASFLALCVIAAVIALFAGIITKNPSFGMLTACVLIIGVICVYLAFPVLLEGALQKILNALSLFDRLSFFVNGILDFGSVVYYLSVSALFTFLTIQTVEKRRWS